jgi:hypothetical protein
MARHARWSEAIAVGNLSFVEKQKSELGFKAAHPAAMRRFKVQEPAPDLIRGSKACPEFIEGFEVILDCSNRRLAAHMRSGSEAKLTGQFCG